MKLEALYRRSVKGRKATMTETEELARWLGELINEAVLALKDGKIQIYELPQFLGTLLSAKDAFQGLDKLDDEFKQAELDDFLHLKDTLVAALADVTLPTELIDELVELTISFVKVFKRIKSLV